MGLSLAQYYLALQTGIIKVLHNFILLGIRISLINGKTEKDYERCNR